MTNQPTKQDRGDPWQALAGAVVLKAVQDARAGDPCAAAWLANEAMIYLDALGVDLDPEYLQAWVKSGCPGAKKPVQRPRLEKRASFPGKASGVCAVGDPGKAGQRERRL